MKVLALSALIALSQSRGALASPVDTRQAAPDLAREHGWNAACALRREDLDYPFWFTCGVNRQWHAYEVVAVGCPDEWEIVLPRPSRALILVDPATAAAYALRGWGVADDAYAALVRDAGIELTWQPVACAYLSRVELLDMERWIVRDRDETERMVADRLASTRSRELEERGYRRWHRATSRRLDDVTPPGPCEDGEANWCAYYLLGGQLIRETCVIGRDASVRVVSREEIGPDAFAMTVSKRELKKRAQLHSFVEAEGPE